MEKFAINFFIVGQVNQFAYRALTQAHQLGNDVYLKISVMKS